MPHPSDAAASTGPARPRRQPVHADAHTVGVVPTHAVGAASSARRRQPLHAGSPTVGVVHAGVAAASPVSPGVASSVPSGKPVIRRGLVRRRASVHGHD
jgi:hypothetical protein